jgi:hypothetical protein
MHFNEVRAKHSPEIRSHMSIRELLIDGESINLFHWLISIILNPFGDLLAILQR